MKDAFDAFKSDFMRTTLVIPRNVMKNRSPAETTKMQHDQQFSIPAMSLTGRMGRIFIDIFGGGEYLIEVRGKLIRFEWSEQFGPLPINKDGSEALSVGPKHAFWRAASLWNLQGQRVENGRCIWHEPKKPVLKHLGGKNYLIVEDGEPGHDW